MRILYRYQQRRSVRNCWRLRMSIVSI